MLSDDNSDLVRLFIQNQKDLGQPELSRSERSALPTDESELDISFEEEATSEDARVIGYLPPKQGYLPPRDGYLPPKKAYLPPDDKYLPPKESYLTPKKEYLPPNWRTHFTTNASSSLPIHRTCFWSDCSASPVASGSFIDLGRFTITSPSGLWAIRYPFERAVACVDTRMAYNCKKLPISNLNRTSSYGPLNNSTIQAHILPRLRCHYAASG